VILYLDLSGLGLTSLPRNILACKNLKALDLSENKNINCENLNSLQSLEVIFIESANLDIFPKEITELKELTSINLNDNNIKGIPDEIENLTSLTGFNLTSNQISSLPESLFNLKSLVTLYLPGNKLDSISERLGNLEHLEHLYLSGNKIKKLPNSIYKLKNLKVLILEAIELENINKEIENLSDLEALQLSYNKIKSIPEEIGNLSNLKSLQIDNNELTEISKGILKLPKLESLSLENNKIKSIPTSLNQLKNLADLDISSNNISIIEDGCFLNLKNLRGLRLANNNITSLNSSIKDLENLKILELSMNSLKTLPTEIKYLLSLENINLMFNNLEILPDEICDLSLISGLFIDGNNLQEYPLKLSNLKRLNRLYLGGAKNPLNKMQDTVDMGLWELFEYLNNLQGISKHSIFWQIPKSLQVSFQQYLSFFSVFVEKITGKEIIFEVSKTSGGLKLSAQTSKELSIEEIDKLLKSYLSLLSKTADDIDLNYESLSTKQQIFEFRQFIRDIKSENVRLKDKVQDYYEKVMLLSDNNTEKDNKIAELNFEIKFFKEQSTELIKIISNKNSNNQSIGIVFDPLSMNYLQYEKKIKESIDVDVLIFQLMQKLIRMMEDKHHKQIEDLHNKELAQWLRDKGYNPSEQTQSGISNVNYGELDIMIRSNDNGTPISIIEALKSSSCGANDTNISSHIDKLIHDYDTAGHKVNFLIVYCEAKKFSEYWTNYLSYMENLNLNPGFRNKFPLLTFIDTNISKVVNLKIGLANHLREDEVVKVYHFIVNMSK
jgi:Leucine-rich repeat (LRR) protein